MKATPTVAGANHRRYISSPTRRLSPLAAGLMLMFAMLGHALTTPASATPGLTPEETTYVTLLKFFNIGPGPGKTILDLAKTGHTIAADLRSGISPATEQWTLYQGNPNVSYNQWAQLITSAIVVFAPEQASHIPDMDVWNSAYHDAYEYVHGGYVPHEPQPYPNGPPVSEPPVPPRVPAPSMPPGPYPYGTLPIDPML